MIDPARRLAGRLEATPFASRLGLCVGEITAEAVTACVPYAPVLANAQGFVHGGVAASLAVWSARLVALASDREEAATTRPVSASISYLAAVREEALHATARLAARGRDIVHCEVEVASDRGRPVALALVVVGTGAPPRRGATGAAGPTTGKAAEHKRLLVSPFAREMGMQVSSCVGGAATIRAPHGPNEGLDGAIDPGALLALADTCAALACMPLLDERLRGSATLSLAAVFGDAFAGPVMAVGREVVESGGLRSALVDVVADRGVARDASSGERTGLTACVSYRFVAAESAQ